MSLSGCGRSTPSQFYLLSDMPSKQARVVHLPKNAVVGIGPVTFPKYLNQPQIVTRKNLNHVSLNEFHRWAEPLDDNFKRVLTENMTKIFRGRHVASYPWQMSDNVTHQVKLSVQRFDATENGRVICSVSWQIWREQDHKLLRTKSHTYQEYLGAKFDYSQVAACMSEIIGRLSRDIARDLSRVAR